VNEAAARVVLGSDEDKVPEALAHGLVARQAEMLLRTAVEGRDAPVFPDRVEAQIDRIQDRGEQLPANRHGRTGSSLAVMLSA
jgi:hypothetical protein